MKIKKHPPSIKSLVLIFAVIGIVLFAENTHAEPYKSFLKKAIELGVDGLEVDVQQTADEILVIHHDIKLCFKIVLMLYFSFVRVFLKIVPSHSPN